MPYTKTVLTIFPRWIVVSSEGMSVASIRYEAQKLKNPFIESLRKCSDSQGLDAIALCSQDRNVQASVILDSTVSKQMNGVRWAWSITCGPSQLDFHGADLGRRRPTYRSCRASGDVNDVLRVSANQHSCGCVDGFTGSHICRVYLLLERACGERNLIASGREVLDSEIASEVSPSRSHRQGGDVLDRYIQIRNSGHLGFYARHAQ